MHWRTAIRYSVIMEPAPWTLDELQRVLLEAHRVCGETCLEINRGFIAMTLSGGLDSTLSLAMLRSLFPTTDIRAYTIVGGPGHPDRSASMTASLAFTCAHRVHMPNAGERMRARSALTERSDAATNGAVGVQCLYTFMNAADVRMVIAHDGIDELMGGYWNHRASVGDEQRAAFEHFWKRLVPDHLEPLERIATATDIALRLPYLVPHVVQYCAHIPIADRTSRPESKMLLRAIARRFGVPEEIITRRKRGFCDALCTA